MHRLSWLRKHQKQDPTNLVWAHDLGLSYFWHARNQTDLAQVVADWIQVIANWVMVLDDDEYWKTWAADQTLIYGMTIGADHINEVKDKIVKDLTRFLVEADKLVGASVPSHLEASFYLELQATTLMKQMNGFEIPAQSDIRLACGPVMAETLELRDQVESFFADWPPVIEEHESIVKRLLVYTQQNGHISALKMGNLHRQLRICFSDLGIAAMHLKQARPLKVLESLEAARCPDCDSGMETAQSQSWSRCHDDCASFPRHNLAYTRLVGGIDLHWRDALELGVCAHLLTAYQALSTQQPKVTEALQQLLSALELAELIGLRPLLAAALGDVLIAWSTGLEQMDCIDEAIELLQADFGPSAEERRHGKLAELHNRMGVQFANSNQWAKAIEALRQAYILNRQLPLIRRNLAICLTNYVDQEIATLTKTEICNCLREALDVAREEEKFEPGNLLEVQEYCQTRLATWCGDLTPSPEPKREPHRYEFPPLTPAELAQPVLFDIYGQFRWEQLDAGGQAIMRMALDLAAQNRDEIVRLPYLLIALCTQNDGETRRLLAEQGVPPWQVQQRAQAWAGVPSSTSGDRLQDNSHLSQFNLGFGAILLLKFAWELAQYDEGMIGEPHLFYALFFIPGAAQILKQAGVDLPAAARQVGAYRNEERYETSQ